MAKLSHQVRSTRDILIFDIGVAPNSTTLIVGRAITGAGVAGYLAGSYIIIGVAVAEKQRPALTGLMGSAYAIASVVGPLIGGALTDRASWRWWYVGALAILVTNC